MVLASFQNSDVGLCSSHAFGIGAHPAACTAIIFGLSDPIQPRYCISSKAFHIPMSPTPAPGRIENRVRQLPVELLGDLVAHRLLPLDPERLLEARDIEPAFCLLALVDHFRAVADQSVDEGYVCTILLALHAICDWDVLRHEDVRFQAASRAVRRERARRVAGRGDRNLLDPVRLAHGYTRTE